MRIHHTPGFLVCFPSIVHRRGEGSEGKKKGCKEKKMKTQLGDQEPLDSNGSDTGLSLTPSNPNPNPIPILTLDPFGSCVAIALVFP